MTTNTKIKVPITLTVKANGEKAWEYAEIEVKKIAKLLSSLMPN